MNEVTLAEMADRLVKMHEEDGIGMYFSGVGDMTQRDADLLNGEMERRGVGVRVFLMTGFTIR